MTDRGNKIFFKFNKKKINSEILSPTSTFVFKPSHTAIEM